ncbi:MAG TPA: glycosyltransferase family 4 protein, partial [Anaerolineales bacterium]|nr:glycosyltransferase family 4 protein [Anaerolineales bacterium]
MTSDLSGRGANFIRAWNLGRAMAETGHAVTLLAGPPSMTLRPRRTRFAGFDLLCGAALEPRRFRRSGWGPADLAGRWAALRRLDFDIVHVFGHRPAAWLPLEALPGRPDRLVAADWADWYGVGGIAEQRGRIGRLTVGRLDDWLERRMARWAAGMTVITRRLEAMALERGFGSTKVLRLTAGADTRSIVPLPKA